MSFHVEVIGARQRKALRQLGAFLSERDCYLGGGTAIALQLGHRHSVDLDWFTARSFDSDALAGQMDAFRGQPGVNVEAVEPGTVHATLSGVRLSVLEYRYPLLRPLVDWPLYECRLASLEDLGCMKLVAIAQRGAKKDFIDLYALGQRGFSLERLLEAYRQKYQARDVAHVLYALTWFVDADEQRTPKMLWPVDWRECKRAIRSWVKALSTRSFPA